MASGVYPWPGRLAAKWGHFAPELLMGSIGAVILLGFRPIASTFALTGSLALVVFILASWLLMRRHDRGLCEHCVAALPLNPSELAVRYQRRFWLAHNGSERRFVIPYLVVLIGSNFATGPIGRLFWAVVQASMIYLILSYSTHRRLQPWCPWCRDDGGGSDKDEPATPDPMPDGRRQLI